MAAPGSRERRLLTGPDLATKPMEVVVGILVSTQVTTLAMPSHPTLQDPPSQGLELATRPTPPVSPPAPQPRPSTLSSKTEDSDSLPGTKDQAVLLQVLLGLLADLRGVIPDTLAGATRDIPTIEAR